MPFICALIAFVTLFNGCTIANASNCPKDMYRANCLPVAGYTCTEIVDAIYIAEGGAKTRHPYGILTKYKHTTPREACLNTVKHQVMNYIELGCPGDFIVFLGRSYAPLMAENDPEKLNKNWVGNVKSALRSERGEKNVL